MKPRWGTWAIAGLLLSSCSVVNLTDSERQQVGPAGQIQQSSSLPPGPYQIAVRPGPMTIPLTFKIENAASVARTQTLQASVPFAEGVFSLADLNQLSVDGHQTAWVVLQQWRDGSLKIAQAQFTDTLAAGATKTYTVQHGTPALTAPFARHSWVNSMAAGLEIGAEVKDSFGVPYRAFANGSATVVQESSLIRVRRYHVYHQALPGNPGIGRDFLTSTFYLTEYRDMPFVQVDWIVGNDYLGADNPAGSTDPNLYPLGSIDVNAATFLVKGASGVFPYRANLEGIGAATPQAGGYTGFQVFSNTYIGDRQTRRYRFLLGAAPASAPPAQVAQWLTTAGAMTLHPAYALASSESWRLTKAAGLLGGPIAGGSNAMSTAVQDLNAFNNSSFGTWGDHYDIKVTATTGTPRNHPLTPTLGHAIQAEYPKLLVSVEQQAWIQAARLYHYWGLDVGDPPSTNFWNGHPHSGNRLGRDNLQNLYLPYKTLASAGNNHGWEAYDYEHLSLDQLFDYYTVSGDPWAKEELRQLGEQVKGILNTPYLGEPKSTRGEGWCMQALTQVYQVTRDSGLRTFAINRAVNHVDVYRHKNHPSKSMVWESNYPGTLYPNPHEFFMPWQHGGVLYGYLGSYKAMGHPLFLTLAEDVVATVHYSWMQNVTVTLPPPILTVFAPHALRYYVPATHNGNLVPANHFDSIFIHVGDSPLGGAHGILKGGLLQLPFYSNDPAVIAGANAYGTLLRGSMSTLDRRSKWNFLVPE